MEQSDIYQAKQKSFWKRNWILLLVGVLVLVGVGYYVIHQSSVRKESTVAVVNSNAPKNSASPIEGSVTLSSAEAIKANVQTVVVEQREFIKDIQAVGTIKIAEPNEHVISSRTRGRIEHLHVNATGRVVRKGDPLYDYYSPDLLNAEQEYLIALKGRSTRMTPAGALRTRSRALCFQISTIRKTRRAALSTCCAVSRIIPWSPRTASWFIRLVSPT